MTANLVTFLVYALDEGRVASLGVIDLSFTAVVTDNEEGGFDISGFQQVEKVRSIDVWAIVECESNFSGN
jgi:hypothetical protein